MRANGLIVLQVRTKKFLPYIESQESLATGEEYHPVSTAMNVIDNSYLWNSVRTTFASALAQLATQFVQNDQFKCATLVYSLFTN